MVYFTSDTRMELSFSIRTKVFLNNDVALSAGSVASELGIRNALIVTGPVTAGSERATRVMKSLQDAGIECVIWDGVKPNAPEASIGECTVVYRRGGCDGIIAIGGGSAMDTAKMAGCLIMGGGSIREYDSVVQQKQVPRCLPPLVCIPTTAGSGSEVTSMAVFSHADDSSKRVLMSPNLFPKVALVDPLMSHTMPPGLTAATGMDAFSHAVESYLSTMSNPISDALSLYAIELIAEFLPRAVKDGDDSEARAAMAGAATMAGMAINLALPHFAHAIGHILSARFGLTHGVACSLALTGGLRKIKDAQLDKFGKIGRAVGLTPGEHEDPEAVADATIETVERMIREIGIPRIQDVVRITNGELAEVAAAAALEPGMMFSPVYLSEDDILEILQ